MATTSELNRVVQVGVEVTPGTTVAATKKLQLIKVETQADPTVQKFDGTARRFPVSHKLNAELSRLKLGGFMNYTELVYVLSNLYGAATITTPTGAVLTRKWVWQVPLSGSITRQTLTIEEGDTIAARKMGYGLLQGWGFKADRETQIPITGDGVAQIESDSITLTAALSAVAQIPILGKHGNVYLDTTFANIGTTQIAKPISTELKWAKDADVYWAMNRSNPSYVEHVDMPPDVELVLEMPNDAFAATMDGYARTDQTVYARVNFQGDLIENTTPNYFYTLNLDIPARIVKIDSDKGSKGVRIRTFHLMPIEDATAGFGMIATLFTTLVSL